MDDMDGITSEDPEGALSVLEDTSGHGEEAGPLQAVVSGDAVPPGPPPDWWHREHPTFTALSGFFSGLAFATLVPGLFVATVRALTSERTAEEAFPFVLAFLVIPIGLLIFPRTRRFGKYLLLGIVTALLVIFGVGTVVFWLMVNYSA
jgi:hypothetical protein